MSFGAGDFTNDVGMTWTPGEEELAELRVRLIVASRAAGLEPPIDTVDRLSRAAYSGDPRGDPRTRRRGLTMA